MKVEKVEKPCFSKYKNYNFLGSVKKKLRETRFPPSDCANGEECLAD